MEWIDAKSVLALWDKLLSERKLTDGELARVIGVSRSSITRWRQGKTTSVHPRIIRDIESALNVTIKFTSRIGWVITNSQSFAASVSAKNRNQQIESVRNILHADIDRVIDILLAK